jgi:hypothetical protein
MTQELQGLDGVAGTSEMFNSFVQSVRLFLRDYSELNRIVKGEEHSNRMIAFAVMDFLSDFAGSPPFLGYYTIEDLCHMHMQSFATRGTVINLLQSVGMLQTRNQLTFSDGGISVGISDKSPLLMQWIRDFQNKYEQQKTQIKVSLNIQQLFGTSGVHSEFFFVNGWYGIY